MSDPDVHSWRFGGGVPPPRPGDRQRALSPGERFDGRFEVREVLGLGGMGVVYRAQDLTTGRDVALKVLRGEVDDRRRERLRREGELSAAFNHPGIVRIHSAGEVEGSPYLAYELVEGSALSWEDLDARDLPSRVSLLLEVTRAVAHAHAHGVVHRDLKPENVLIDASGRARVTDFGLGWTQTLERLTQSGALIGTPRYMSPEQATGALDRIGPASDVWALGVMLYRALSGVFPFGGERLLELQAQVCQAEPRPPRALNREVSADMQAVCLKCLSKAVGDRYVDAGALAEDLDNALESRPVTASTASWWGAPKRRRARGLLLAGFATLVLGGALAIPAWRAKAWEREARALVVAAEGEGPAATRDALVAAAADARWRTLPATLRARGHLLLATGPAQTPTDWKERAQHARLARELSPGEPVLAERALGRALMGLGAPREAAAAFGRARVAGAGLDAALERVDALLAADEIEGALHDAQGLVERPRWRGPALAHIVPALLERGVVEGARRVVEFVPLTAHSHEGLLLCADVESARGGDPLEFLEGVVERSPQRPEAIVALAMHLVDVGEVEAAGSLVRRARDREVAGPEFDRLARLLEACLAVPPRLRVVEREERRIRDAVARWWVTQGERDVAFLRRAKRPDAVPTPNALGEIERRRRALRAFEWAESVGLEDSICCRALIGVAQACAPEDAGRSLDALESALRLQPTNALALCLRAERLNALGDAKGALAALDAVQAPPAPLASALAWERGVALLALGQAAQAVPALQDALGPEPLDHDRCAVLLRALEKLGRAEEARMLRDRMGLLAGSRRAEAEVEFQVIVEARRGKVGGEIVDMAPAAEHVLELDPLHLGARYNLGLGLYLQGDREEGLRECLRATSRFPRYLCEAQRLELSGRIPAWVLKESSLRFEDRDPLLRGFRAANHVEQVDDLEALPLATRLMTRVLEEDPSEAVAWIIRAFLHTRARRFAQAERDLRVAKEAAPDCSVIPFYEALLLGAKGAPADDVLTALQRARSLGYDQWRVARWTARSFPELRPYLGVPGIKEVFAARGVSDGDLVRSQLRGSFDGFRDGSARGWAWDPSSASEHVTVRITADGPPGVGKLIGDALANLKRGDVVHVIQFQGEFGFKFPLPPWARGRMIHVVVMHTIGGGFTELEGSPRRFKAR